MKSVVSLLAFAALAIALPLNERALPTPGVIKLLVLLAAYVLSLIQFSVSVATAKTYLAALTVAVDSNSPAYDRDLFKTWDTSWSLLLILLSFSNTLPLVSGNCNTRESERAYFSVVLPVSNIPFD